MQIEACFCFRMRFYGGHTSFSSSVQKDLHALQSDERYQFNLGQLFQLARRTDLDFVMIWRGHKKCLGSNSDGCRTIT